MNQKWKTLMKAISILIFRIKKIYYNTIKLPKISNYLPQELQIIITNKFSRYIFNRNHQKAQETI